MTTATLNGFRVTDARVSIPAWGCWSADVSIDVEQTIVGRVSLVVADITLSGTVLSGGASKGRSSFRIVAGGGGWGRTLKKKRYDNDAGVKLSAVLGDAATEAGEVMGPIDPTIRVGPSWTRPADPGVLILEQVASGAWYVDEAGVTQLGKRAAATLPAGVTHGPVDLARKTVTLASDTIATIRPGLVVDGLTAVDVEHTVSAKGGLRSMVWGSLSGGSSRDLEALRKLDRILDPFRKFRGITEYRVAAREGNRLTLQPILSSLGMPDLARVPVRPGVAGCDAEVVAGARVLVGFVNADPARAYVGGFEGPDGAGFLPTSLSLLNGSAGVSRVGDSVSISVAQFAAAGALAPTGGGPVAITTPIAATITGGSSKVTCG